MVRHHHRIAPAIALALALAAAAPAAARPEPNPPPVTAHASGPASTNLCSEVCGAGGYTAATRPAGTVSSTIASGSGPRSEVVAGGGYSNPGGHATVVRVVNSGSGFDWGDAGVGAGGAVAITTLLVGGILGATSLRRRATRGTAQPTS
jgi:hypothetical protein